MITVGLLLGIFPLSSHQTEHWPSMMPLPLIVILLSFVNKIHCKVLSPQAAELVGAIILPSNCIFLCACQAEFINLCTMSFYGSVFRIRKVTFERFSYVWSVNFLLGLESCESCTFSK